LIEGDPQLVTGAESLRGDDHLIAWGREAARACLVGGQHVLAGEEALHRAAGIAPAASQTQIREHSDGKGLARAKEPEVRLTWA
jgi:hypothetical protein